MAKKMAASETFANYEKKCADTTFDYSMTSFSSVVKSLCPTEEEEDEDEDSRTRDDGPVVFICGKCKLPLGDSVSWDGSEDGENQIRLKRVSDNVLIGKETRVHEPRKGHHCLIVDLICQSCSSVLGMVYTSTPKDMDHKRFTFCFNVADIDSYIIGSANHMLAAGGPKEQLVTMEYRDSVEKQLTELKVLVMSMGQRLQEIEIGLQLDRDQAQQ